MFDQVENLKQEFTDKYVVVQENVPDLRRFEGYVGQVKTVNMNGRALVQFEAWNNIGWYDIDVALLRVVPKPEPKPEGHKEEPKRAAKASAAPAAAAGAKKLSPLEMARAQGAFKGAAATPAGDKPAAKPAAPASKPAPAAGGKKSTADILAAARANKASAAAPAEAVPAEAVPAEAAPAAEESPPEDAPAAAPAAPKPAAAKPAFAPGVRPGVPEILAWCREHDAK